MSHGTASWQVPFHDFAWVAGGIGLVLAWAAAVAYLVPARQALVEGRAARGAAQNEAAQNELRAERGGEVGA